MFNNYKDRKNPFTQLDKRGKGWGYSGSKFEQLLSIDSYLFTLNSLLSMILEHQVGGFPNYGHDVCNIFSLFFSQNNDFV